jgi:hypothetical protein
MQETLFLAAMPALHDNAIGERAEAFQAIGARCVRFVSSLLNSADT